MECKFAIQCIHVEVRVSPLTHYSSADTVLCNVGGVKPKPFLCWAMTIRNVGWS